MQGRDRSGSTKWIHLFSKVDQQTGSTILQAYLSRVFCISCMSITFHNPKMNKLLDTFLRLLHFLPVEFTFCNQEIVYSVPCLILLLRLLHFNLPPEGWQCQNFKLMKDYKLLDKIWPCLSILSPSPEKYTLVVMLSTLIVTVYKIWILGNQSLSLFLWHFQSISDWCRWVII